MDSNGAALLIARALAPGKAVWIDFDPPPQAKLAAEAYMLAVADPASHGARWVISLDDQLRADLTAKKQPAADTWKKLIGTVAFFEQHKETQDLSAERPAGGDVEFRRARLGYRRGGDQPASPAAPAVPGDCAIAGGGRLFRRSAGHLLRR